ncbi:MAG: ankyrin repeat domain-containing protein [Thermodesulfobacteriota bacterium]
MSKQDGRVLRLTRTTLATGVILLLLVSPGLPQTVDENQELMQAARKGHLQEVERLLDNGVDVNTEDEKGRTPIAWAAIGGHRDVVNMLKSHGGKYTLFIAAAIGDTGEAQRLIDSGAEVNATDKVGLTALMWAAEKGHTDVMRLLLEKGADVDAKDPKGNTALMAAVGWRQRLWVRREQNTDVVKLLLEKGADVNVKNIHGCTPLLGATWGSHSEVARELLKKGADIHVDDSRGRTALMKAAGLGKLELVKLLLDSGAEVNKADEQGRTPLMEAARSSAMTGKDEKVRLLLDKGASVNAKDMYGRTALMIAASIRNGFKAAKALLDHGADVNAKDKDGKTTLMQVLEPTFTGTFETGSMRFGPGGSSDAAYKQAKFTYGSPALLVDEQHLCKQMVELLLNRGANARARDKDGRTALSRVLEPLIEVQGDSMTESGEKGTVMSVKIENDQVRVTRDPPKGIVELLRASGARQ